MDYQNRYDKAKSRKAQRPSFINDSLAYGNEFTSSSDITSNNTHNHPAFPEEKTAQEMYVSITPAYQDTTLAQPIDHQAAIDYNIQDSYLQAEPSQAQQAFTHSKFRVDPRSLPATPNVLTANPQSYTIEWMSGSRKSSLERAKLRYSELQGTQIIHYRKNKRNRYALVSMLFVKRSEALNALLAPSLSRVSTRFSPKVRQVGYLQSLVENTPQVAKTKEFKYRDKPLNKRRWNNISDKTYLVNRSNRQQNNFHTALNHRLPAKKIAPTTSVAPHVKSRSFSDSPKNRYTIQWFSSSSLESIARLKQRFPELAAAETVRVQRNQKNWYVLIQGNYKSSQEAITALKSPTMKSIAMILHPWTRPLHSLKKMQIASL